MGLRRRPSYETEPVWLRELVWERGYVAPWEMLQICAWKSANANLALLSANTPEAIVETTRQVVDVLLPYRDADIRSFGADEHSWSELRTRLDDALGTTSGLRKLHGVRLPVASAVLAILNPAMWPVVDRWAIAAMCDPTPSLWQQGKFSFYWSYLRRLELLQREHGRDETIHVLDQLLYNRMRRGEPIPFPRVAPH